ncbi:ABC transporter ATP-binding protein [Bacillus rubiinfantis]|uniref:ABC transporter ATP-binding protein n=1 Tax=Bacillus rubiinfantis TaxID=1499680 RepID=UPI0005A65D4A|nr:ABC transporter ATP-binding protein [Bacillus rubiinfantis]
MTVRLEIDRASKVFKNKTALYPFTFSAEAGQCIALLGGNGAGKSTLLHLIAGLSLPSGGKILIDDIDIRTNRTKYVSLIGYMPDEFFAQETLTVLEFFQFYGAIRKVSPAQIQEVLQQLGLAEKQHERIAHLSKGMRQRLLFGQSWLGNPAVLILDEPTNGLDPYWITVFIDLLIGIKNSGTTIIFSTHMMDVAAETADQIIFMDHGKISEIIVNQHENPEQLMVNLTARYRQKHETMI